MNINIDITNSELNAMAADVKQRVEEARPGVQAKMAVAFQEMVFANFGPTGDYRPNEWPALQESTIRSYRKRKPPITRTYATLYITGRLMNGVLLDASNSPDSMRVVAEDSNVPYATVHQYGGGNGIPRRGYFPLTADDEPTAEAQAVVLEAARTALLEALN